MDRRLVEIELVTIPGSGTRSVTKMLPNAVLNTTLDTDTRIFGDITVCHLDKTNLQRLLKQKHTLIISTWRDPLSICITNTHRYFLKRISQLPEEKRSIAFQKQMMGFFERFKLLRNQKHVLIVDLRFVPFREGNNEFSTRNPVKQDNSLRKAYQNRNIKPIENAIGGLLNELRQFDWGDLWTEDWWREV